MTECEDFLLSWFMSWFHVLSGSCEVFCVWMLDQSDEGGSRMQLDRSGASYSNVSEQ